MFNPLSLSIALRYISSKKRSGFVSFISFTSMFGIALGVMVLITVLSVMNGFDEEIHQRFFSMAPEITINDYSGAMRNWQEVAKKIENVKGIKAIAPFVGGQGLAAFQGRNIPIIITGILPEKEDGLTKLSEKITHGNLKHLSGFNIVLGESLASQLGVFLDEPITVMIPQLNTSLAGSTPRFKRFNVNGIFSAGTGFNFDSRLGFIHLSDAQKLFKLGESVSGLRIKIDNVYDAPMISRKISDVLDNQYAVGNWTEQYGAFFKAVKMEKTMMFLILILIIAVAAFNLVSSLVMMVNDKQADIAIIRTIGGQKKLVLLTFMWQGLMVGLIGTFIGIFFGVLLALNAPAIVDFLQSYFHTQWLSANVNFVDKLPSKLEWQDIFHVSLVSLFLSFMATLYPSLKAANVNPAEALRYE